MELVLPSRTISVVIPDSEAMRVWKISSRIITGNLKVMSTMMMRMNQGNPGVIPTRVKTLNQNMTTMKTTRKEM
jgi:hypothetical protein